MSPKQFKARWAALRRESGLGYGALAEAFGYARRQPLRWEDGSAPVPKLVAFVLDLLETGKVKLKDLDER
jgi:hypothetical protein